jgi:hypothetical protein
MIDERGHTHIVRHLGGVPRFHKASLVLQAGDLLAAEEAERARTVLILDEAHLLSGEQLDEVRMLTNHDMDCRSPLPPSRHAGAPDAHGLLTRLADTARNRAEAAACGEAAKAPLDGLVADG